MVRLIGRHRRRRGPCLVRRLLGLLAVQMQDTRHGPGSSSICRRPIEHEIGHGAVSILTRTHFGSLLDEIDRGPIGQLDDDPDFGRRTDHDVPDPLCQFIQAFPGDGADGDRIGVVTQLMATDSTGRPVDRSC